MPSFKIINDINQLNRFDDWEKAEKFNSRYRIVDKHGKALEPSSVEENRYRLISKKERHFSCLERFGRMVAGQTFLEFFPSTASSRPVTDLFLRKKETVRFGIPVKSEEEEQKISEKELKKELFISPETISKLEKCIEDIVEAKEIDGLNFFYKNQGDHRIFELDTDPEFIFKMHLDGTLGPRYENMVRVMTILRTRNLAHLVIPKAIFFTVTGKGNQKYEIIAEQKLNINRSESAQEQLYEDGGSTLDEAIDNVAVLIAEDAYGDAAWRNIPVLEGNSDKHGNKKIALVDLEKPISQFQFIENGLFGLGFGFGGRGLVQCVNEKQGEIVRAVAAHYGISTELFADAHAIRIKEIEEKIKLKEYHVAKKILQGNEPISVKEEDLDFSSHSSEETFKAIAIDVIKMMNEQIAKSSPKDTIKGRRQVMISLDLSTKGPPDYIDWHNYLVDGEEGGFTAFFMRFQCVMRKLEEVGAIYKVIAGNPYGYCVQA